MLFPSFLSPGFIKHIYKMKMRQPQRLKDTLQNKSKTKPAACTKLPKDLHFQKRLRAGLDRDVHHVTVPESRMHQEAAPHFRHGKIMTVMVTIFVKK